MSLKKLMLAQIVSFEVIKNKCHIIENCDYYYFIDFNKSEMIKLIKDLQNLTDKMK